MMMTQFQVLKLKVWTYQWNTKMLILQVKWNLTN